MGHNYLDEYLLAWRKLRDLPHGDPSREGYAAMYNKAFAMMNPHQRELALRIVKSESEPTPKNDGPTGPLPPIPG